MKKCLALLVALFFLTSLVVLPHTTVKAQSKTIVVPDDYASITDAIGNATNGDTILVRPGTYYGPINSTIIIDKSISIFGQNASDTIINLYPSYNVTWILDTPEYSYTDGITITSDSCTLQDLTIQMANPGGSITSEGNSTLIVDDIITTGEMNGVNIEGSNCMVTNNVMDGRIQVSGNYNEIDSNSANFVQVGVSQVGEPTNSYNFIEDNTCQGLGLTYSTNNVFIGNNISSDTWQLAGVDLSWSNNNYIEENQISGLMYGLRFWFSSNNTVVKNSVNDSLNTCLSFGASSDNLFSLNNFANNSFASSPYVYDQYSDPNYRSTVIVLSTNIWSDSNLGNYWSDYLTKYPNATEVDSTGNIQVGSIPYFINDNNIDPYPLMTNYPISTAPIDLDALISLTVSNLVSTPSFPPSPIPIKSIPIEQPTASTIPSPTLPPSPNPAVPEFPPWIILPMLVIMLVSAGLTIYFKKRKHQPQ